MSDIERPASMDVERTYEAAEREMDGYRTEVERQKTELDKATQFLTQQSETLTACQAENERLAERKLCEACGTYFKPTVSAVGSDDQHLGCPACRFKSDAIQLRLKLSKAEGEVERLTRELSFYSDAFDRAAKRATQTEAERDRALSDLHERTTQLNRLEGELSKAIGAIQEIGVKRDRALTELARLREATLKFMSDIEYLPPWESAGTSWAEKIRILHKAALDATPTDTTHNTTAPDESPQSPSR